MATAGGFDWRKAGLQGASGGGVVVDVGEVGHGAAAQRAAEEAHVVDVGPLVGALVVALRVEGGGEAVEAAHREEPVVHHLDPEVAAGGDHVRDAAPGVGLGVVGVDAAQAVHPVKAAHLREGQRSCISRHGRKLRYKVQIRNKYAFVPYVMEGTVQNKEAFHCTGCSPGV